METQPVFEHASGEPASGVGPVPAAAPELALDRGSAHATGTTGRPGAADSQDVRPRGAWVSRSVVNFWLDFALMLVFAALSFESAVLQFLFPAGPTGFDWLICGRTLTGWRNLQFGTLCLLGAGIVLHVMLHWSWVCGLIRTRWLRLRARDDTGADTLWGVILLVALLHVIAAGLLLAWMTRRLIAQ
jgi:hypothetical protein